jgi:abortive infection bacteriophage resistance protein
MPIPYAKPYLTINEQIALLEHRGMVCADHIAATGALRRYGYYRLSGYWYPFRQVGLTSGSISETFRPGTAIENAITLADFDKRLRVLFLDALEQIEVALRVDVALIVGKHDPIAHRIPKFLHGNFTKKIDTRTGLTQHATWMQRLDDMTSRTREDFVQSFRMKYTTPLPVWIAIEIWDFGMLSRFVGGMTVADRQKLATRYAISDWRLIDSWVRALGDVRNIAAHHARLWNRVLVNTPAVPAAGAMPDLDHLRGDLFAQRRIYAAAAIIQHLLRQIDPASTWPRLLNDLLAAFPAAPSVGVAQTGFPQDWPTLNLWR